MQTPYKALKVSNTTHLSAKKGRLRGDFQE